MAEFEGCANKKSGYGLSHSRLKEGKTFEIYRCGDWDGITR
mgnify:CR=1 FL=1